MNRLVARVDVLNGATEHFVGLPPVMTQGLDSRKPMPDAAWLVIEYRDNGYFLFRYSDSRVFAGDTWHESLSRAFGQAEFEYGLTPDDWIDVPDDVSDPLEFAVERLGTRPS